MKTISRRIRIFKTNEYKSNDTSATDSNSALLEDGKMFSLHTINLMSLAKT